VNFDEYRSDVVTRQRLVQIFLLISGFFLALAEGEAKKALGLVFLQFVIFALLYYIVLAQSKHTFFINLFGVLTAYSYSLFILLFTEVQVGDSLSLVSGVGLFLLFLSLFTFAFLAPATTKRMTHSFHTAEQRLTKTQRKAVTWVVRLLVIVLLVVIFWASVEITIYL